MISELAVAAVSPHAGESSAPDLNWIGPAKPKPADGSYEHGLKETVKPRSDSALRTPAEADGKRILGTLMQTDGLIGEQDGAANRLGLPHTTLIYDTRKLGIETHRCRAHAPFGNWR